MVLMVTNNADKEREVFSLRLNNLLDLRGFAPKNQGRQTQLAKKMGVSHKGARKWLEGEAIPRLETVIQMAEQLNVNVQWLHYGHGVISDQYEITGQRISKARQGKGWSQGELAKKLEEWTIEPLIKVAGIQAIESGTRMEISPALEAYAGVLEVSEHWLSGEDDESQVELTNLALSRNHDNIVIPQLSATGSMGKGIHADLEHDTVVSQVSVNKLWIQENLSSISSPSNLAMITGHGDSMEGTFNHGDVLFVDTGIDKIKMDAVYILNLNDELYIKRLQRKPDGSIIIISDNAKYQPYVIQNGEKDKFQVLGRIVSIWNFKRM